MRESMRQPVIIDGRNIWDPKRVRNRGFTYYAIGRP
jgi:UDPglucose 6-dehydrogenase